MADYLLSKQEAATETREIISKEMIKDGKYKMLVMKDKMNKFKKVEENE
jgi:hypothetical protein